MEAVADGMEAVDGMVADGEVADGMEDTTAVAGIGMPGIIDGTAAGVGGEVVGTRGGFFRFRCLTLIHITEGTTVQGMGTGMGMDRVTVTDTESSDRHP